MVRETASYSASDSRLTALFLSHTALCLTPPRYLGGRFSQIGETGLVVPLFFRDPRLSARSRFVLLSSVQAFFSAQMHCRPCSYSVPRLLFLLRMLLAVDALDFSQLAFSYVALRRRCFASSFPPGPLRRFWIRSFRLLFFFFPLFIHAPCIAPVFVS